MQKVFHVPNIKKWKSIASILVGINKNGSKNPSWKMDAKNVKNGHH